MRLLAGFLACIAQLGCGPANERSEPARAREALPQRAPSPTVTGDDSLTCAPAVLGANDTLELRMRVPHGPYLALTTPDSTWFFVVYPLDRDETMGARHSLMPADSFSRVSTLRLPVRALRAAPWVFGRDTNELVFARAGRYRVVVGHHLETDGAVVHSCTVQFTS